MTMKKYMTSLLLILTLPLCAQLKISSVTGHGSQSVALSTEKGSCMIVYDTSDYTVVSIASNLLAEDILRVTGKKVVVSGDRKMKAKDIVIIGTIGHNALIDDLILSGKMNADPIRNRWERYIIKTISHPFQGVSRALVIAGSDRRGTAYGVFTLSEAIGVSPWYWWADVPVKQQPALYIEPVEFISQSPSVKYRGIFINDEDWGMKPWASKMMDPELQDIGPHTYAKVFELLLRLKANYIWPAMHECSGAFNKYGENKKVADSFAIVMGSSHCEPLLFNNASEWDKRTMGEWNYVTNKKGILEQLEKRVASNFPYENIYTVGLRGLHDAGMIGDLTRKEQIINLQNAIRDQRELLKKYIDKPMESIPQILIPYKEVMTLYENGLEVPEDITLVWPDDNYGYIKRLNTPEEQKRPGGSGVYYHISYLGAPHNYLWMSTTSPALIYEEMSKAYRTGADRVWVVNVGDIKSCEYITDLFLAMAWDMGSFNYQRIVQHTAQWYAQLFGHKFSTDFFEIWDKFYHLAFIRKPEYMGWGYEWNSQQSKVEIITDTEFSFSQNREAERRMNDYDRIARKADSIMKELDDELKPAYFQLVYYPVMAAALMNKKMLTAQQNRLYARQGRAKTNYLAGLTKQYLDSLHMITDYYNSMLNGKWEGMMSLKQGHHSRSYLMPPVDTIVLDEKPVLGLFAEGDDGDNYSPKPFASLPCFNSYAPRTYYIDVVNKGGGMLEWKALPSEKWIVTDRYSGETADEQRVFVSVDWSKLPSGEYRYGEIEFFSGDKKEKVLVSAFQPQQVSHEDLKGLFVEQNGMISIPAAGFHRKNEKSKEEIVIIDGLGIENRSIQFGDPCKRILDPKVTNSSSVEYDFYTFTAGRIQVYVYALPVFPLNSLEGASYAFSIDNGLVFEHDIKAPEYSDVWKQNVLRNCSVTKSDDYLASPGKHTLTLSGITQGMVIQKIVMDMGGLKKSYTGPETTRVN